MSIPSKQSSPDRKQDKSDVLSLLTVIKRLFETSQEVLNTHAQTALMLSITLEAQMLLMKLRVMKDRWQYHLPFKEACRVRFDDWSKRMERMAESLFPTEEEDGENEQVSEYCPSKHFLLDLYETLPENASSPEHVPYYKELAIGKFVTNQDRIRKQIAKNWLASYEQRFSDAVSDKVEKRIPSKLDLLQKHDTDIFHACHDTLLELSVELSELHMLSKREIQPALFTRLAERVTRESDYGGHKASQSARIDVHEWKNRTPKKRLEKSLQEEIDTSISIIRKLKYGCKIEEYIGEEFDIKGHLADFGQFLHNVRRDISVMELNDLMEQLYRIRYFREEQERQKVITTEFLPSETDKPTAKDAQTIYRKRNAVHPQRPKLTSIFNEKFVDNVRAVDKFYDILHNCGFYIGRALLAEEKKDPNKNKYEEWKWKHLREAFMSMGLMRKDATKISFAKFLQSVFPYLDADNVKRGFNSRGTQENMDTFERIVYDVKAEFKAVILLIRGT